MYFTVYDFPHEYFGGGSHFSIKERVNFTWPMHSQVRIVYSLLALLGSSCLSCKMGCWSYFCCHFFVSIWLIFGQCQCMIFWRFCWVLCQEQIWLLSQLNGFPEFLCGTESSRISPVLLWEFSTFKNLMISGLSTFQFLTDKSTGKESEWMMNLFALFVKMFLLIM